MSLLLLLHSCVEDLRCLEHGVCLLYHPIVRMLNPLMATVAFAGTGVLSKAKHGRIDRQKESCM